MERTGAARCTCWCESRCVGSQPVSARKASTAREQALLDFTKQVMDQNGSVSGGDLAAFRAAGFDDRAAIEVVAAITAMTFTALYNHINETTLDFPPVPELTSVA